MPAFQPDFQRYLAAKQSVDDRALNRHVLHTLKEALPVHPNVIEVGCGVGTMTARLLDWEIIKEDAGYLGVDADPQNILAARDKFPQFRFETANVYDLPPGDADLVIAHAFLDLFDIPKVLPVLFNLARPGGLFWFTINFDGVTLFEPPHPLDEIIVGAYHDSMDARVTDGRPSGDSRAGRHLFAHLNNAGAEILAAGSSDWVVHPSPAGYPGDEAYFLAHILHFFEHSLSGMQELADWLAARRAQLVRGELVYIAHQLDFAGRIPGLHR